LRDIFTKALREPGDTPQKGRTRKYIDDTSGQVDPNDWSDVKGKRTNFGGDASACKFQFPRWFLSAYDPPPSKFYTALHKLFSSDCSSVFTRFQRRRLSSQIHLRSVN
jgi:hypothetical protein